MQYLNKALLVRENNTLIIPKRMDTTKIFKKAPRYIVTRFYAINNYVWKVFFPENELNEHLRKLNNKELSRKELSRLKDIVSEASLVVFIFLLKRFFTEGSNAAKKAVDVFSELGIEGFQIGSKYFSERNANVIEGDRLADALISTIDEPELLNLINNSIQVYQIIDRYKKIIAQEN
jgi:hypothetical protein